MVQSLVRSLMRKTLEIMINFTFLVKSVICSEILSVITKLVMIKGSKWINVYLTSKIRRKGE